MKHTPGPWYIEGDRLKGNRDIPTFAIVHGVASTPEHIDQHKRNMNLIIAAPELLQALEEILQHIGTLRVTQPKKIEAFNKAEKAIKKAKGE